MRKLIGRIGSRRLLAVSWVTVLIVAFILVDLAVASNMGFKLNYGIVTAINRLLYGSGISLSQNGAGSTAVLELNLDLANQDLSPRNSNMGFKLNIRSVPPQDAPVEVDVNGTEWILYQDGDGIRLEGSGLGGVPTVITLGPSQ